MASKKRNINSGTTAQKSRRISTQAQREKEVEAAASTNKLTLLADQAMTNSETATSPKHTDEGSESQHQSIRKFSAQEEENVDDKVDSASEQASKSEHQNDSENSDSAIVGDSDQVDDVDDVEDEVMLQERRTKHLHDRAVPTFSIVESPLDSSSIDIIVKTISFSDYGLHIFMDNKQSDLMGGLGV